MHSNIITKHRGEGFVYWVIKDGEHDWNRTLGFPSGSVGSWTVRWSLWTRMHMQVETQSLSWWRCVYLKKNNQQTNKSETRIFIERARWRLADSLSCVHGGPCKSMRKRSAHLCYQTHGLHRQVEPVHQQHGGTKLGSPNCVQPLEFDAQRNSVLPRFPALLVPLNHQKPPISTVSW